MGKSRNSREQNLDRQHGEHMNQPASRQKAPTPQLVEQPSAPAFDFEAAYKAAQIEIAELTTQQDEHSAKAKLEETTRNGLNEFVGSLPPQIQLLLQNPSMAAAAVQTMLSSVKAELSNGGVRVAVPTPFGTLRAEAYLDAVATPAAVAAPTTPVVETKAAERPLWGAGSLDYSEYF